MEMEEIVILRSIEYWVLAQLGLEIVLVLLLIFFLMKMRSMSKMLKTSQEEEKAAASHLTRFSEQLNMLESKRVSLEETLGQLIEKAMLPKDQESSPRLAASEFYSTRSPKPRGASLRRQVEDLHLQGFSLPEIAHRLGLHPTEVKMALDLGRLKAE
jgi:Na+-transporting methylmalonyl-CoA/oxaloacetate decarboxylase gamma subunit